MTGLLTTTTLPVVTIAPILPGLTMGRSEPFVGEVIRRTLTAYARLSVVVTSLTTSLTTLDSVL